MPIKLPSTLPAFDVLTNEGVMVMGETLTMSMVVGCVLAIAGVVAINIRR